MFPVDAILPDIAVSLEANRPVVIQAPPGSGKTTRIAPALLDAPWLARRRILMLEPRRLAARAAAAYLARQRGEAVGETIGCHVRLERLVGPATRIEAITEGILIQRLLQDPELADVGLIIFDEFHERSLLADTGLALALDARAALRPDLRLAVMSATLQPEPIAAYLGPATSIHTASARLFPVETRLLDRMPSQPLPWLVADAVQRVLHDLPGDVLVFLPGEAEIRRTLDLLRDKPLPANVNLYPLYGALPRHAQERAIAPAPPGQRKVALATSIAETSLTLEGVRIVIDAGWMRAPRFSPRTGMSRLETLRVSRDRADQRRGRAGRLGPGVCLRLWDAAVDRQLAPEALPEIFDADLTATVLQAAEWGSAARDGLRWMTPPPDAAWRRGLGLLQDLGALTRDERPVITARGRAMAAIPVHPRLAHMILQAVAAGCGRRACLLAAALAEAGAEGATRQETDVRRLLDRLAAVNAPDPFARRVRELARRWGRAYPATDRTSLSEGALLAWAFPDRIARRREAAGRFLLRNGRGATLDPSDPLAREPWLVAAELQDDDADARIRLAAPLDQDEIEDAFADQFEARAVIRWDRRVEDVVAVNRLCLGAIVVREGGQPRPDPEALREALLEGVRQQGISALPWDKRARAIQARVCFLRRAWPERDWPDFSDDALLAGLGAWLGPACAGLTRWSQIQALDLSDILLARLAQDGFSRRLLDELAPTHLTAPSGSRIQVRYEAEGPCLDVRIQEVFGLTRTPCIAGGRAPVLLRLLSPAYRPVQVTRDLASFWATGYAQARKELRGRYPRHAWPEDPTTATPVRRARPAAP